ncbi:MAG: orotidine-5'-phosphate decarboxylase [Actinomycetota bacterium]|nr:orotidine-5'-phosphate decarboxylase [Actinomycetota bacterium]
MGSAYSSANPICVALDSGDPDICRRLAAETREAGAHKIGLTAFGAGGPDLVRDLASSTRLFLDLKLHDIPAQVAGAVSVVAHMDVTFTTVHASGGRAMLRAAAEAADGHLMVLAVTVLTSLDDSDLSDIGIGGRAPDQVLRLAEVALDSGVPGLVCSPLEVGLIRERFGSSVDGGPFLVVPGIRTDASGGDDQKRTLSPRAAVEKGADLLVVGRPITGSAEPAEATRSLIAELAA